ncbi:hypothetical protein C2845_PM07G03850 [Panicum miliaceum]|uniref:Uncharacterized protein n=1 Tax=Panicum miliaceum TaxID=4540 RepID=A0A3L6SIX6_PANMI|nr:hypothetical protein C2845_PM07G03850 [Panicum miliaceum]
MFLRAWGSCSHLRVILFCVSIGAESQSTSDFEAGQPEVEVVDFLNAAERFPSYPAGGIKA